MSLERGNGWSPQTSHLPRLRLTRLVRRTRTPHRKPSCRTNMRARSEPSIPWSYGRYSGGPDEPACKLGAPSPRRPCPTEAGDFPTTCPCRSRGPGGGGRRRRISGDIDCTSWRIISAGRARQWHRCPGHGGSGVGAFSVDGSHCAGCAARAQPPAAGALRLDVDQYVRAPHSARPTA